MIDDKKVSIVVCTYNRPQYIIECMLSVIQAEYKNKEVIIVDDNSELKNLLSPEYGQVLIDGTSIIFHKNKKNMGLSYSKNKGIELATGNYIKFLDDDDKLIYGSLKKQIDYLDARPEIDVVYSDILRFNDYCILGRMKGPKNIPAGSPLLRKSVLDNIKYDEEFSGKGEDSKLWKDLKAAGYKFAYYEIDSIKYRIHENQFTNKRTDPLYNEKTKKV